jgi:AcrR family transcriptional regulator
MLNHYFANRQDLLQQALVFVSERAQARMRAAIENVPPGRQRLVALLDSSLEEGQEVDETWRVWINAYGEAVRLAGLRHTIESRLIPWYELLDKALEGLVPPEENGAIPWAWRLDAILNGLTLQALTSEAALDSVRIREGPGELSGSRSANAAMSDPLPAGRCQRQAHPDRRASCGAGTVYQPMLRNIERRRAGRERSREAAWSDGGHAAGS